MRKARDEQVDPSQPALIVTYGSTTRKYRRLEGDLVVIGRSPCCDIGIVSPEVAPIHCIMVKNAEGWRIRDCTGRGGTHLNGKSVHDEALTDCDVLQIGTFSMQVNLPRGAGAAAPAPQAPGAAVAPSQRAGDADDERKVLHLKQSRERLARHALNLRRRLRDKHAAAGAPITPSRCDAEVGAQRAELEQREKQLRFWEKELNEEDRRLREEYCEIEHQRKELQQFTETTLARKQEELEAKAQALFAQRREELETEMDRTLAGRRQELEQLADDLRSRQDDLERERGQLEEQVFEALRQEKTGLSAAEEALAQKQRGLEEQFKQVEEINAALDEEREGLRLEKEDVERTRQAIQLEVEAQVREAEEYVEVLWQQCEDHRRRIEDKHGTVVVRAGERERSRALAIRSREQDAYARHLRQTRGTLTQYEQELSDAYQQFHAEYERAVREAQALKDQAKQEAEAARRDSQPHDPLSDTAHGESRNHDEEAALLGELREEHERQCAELTSQLAKERQRIERAEAQMEALKNELADLHDQLRDRDEGLEHLRAELAERDRTSNPSLPNGEIRLAAPEQLLALVEKLQKDVAERDDRIGELDRDVERLQVLTGAVEREAHEAELHRYRADLERERANVNNEIAQLEMMRAEVEEARQEMELSLSRERVQIAREWVEINRVREQLRRDNTQRNQADGAARERPAKAKQTKNEAAETPTAAPAAKPAPQDLIARIRPSTTQSLEVKP